VRNQAKSPSQAVKSAVVTTCNYHQTVWLNIVKESFKSCQDECLEQRNETPPLVTASESTTSSKRYVLRKKLRAEKLALELKIAE